VKRRFSIALCLMLAAGLCAKAQTRNWLEGTLLETEQQKVLEGTTRTTSSSGSSNKDGYSHDSATTKTDNYDTFQVYTISAGPKVYIAREQLYFPWSKPTLSDVGEAVKYAVEKGKLFVLTPDGKQHKMSIVKVSLREAPAQ
jgi:hypothetical protein